MTIPKIENKESKETTTLDFIKSLQGKKAVIVPITLNGVLVHKGMKFDVSATDYNKFISSSQSGKVSIVAASKDFLMHTVTPDSDRQLLTEILKVTGTLDHILPKVIDGAAPNMEAALD
ncbi:putative phage tail assembly chaperone [Photobacterium carnosum]|uniref:putative phage tail assembly chaperone n=1 Tax=Photobacterium carnosum TaxID=2023717 RepID=UPI00242B1D2B|nr:putative phage tail assembly chaperone [Photobacterium carnosum]